MRPFVPALALPLIALLISCGSRDLSTPKNVFGRDNREVVPVSAPWHAVGRLDVGCTAVMIGHRLALTAAHCVVDSTSGAIRSGITTLRLGVRPGNPSTEHWIEYFWLGSTDPESERLKDWAILLLEDEAGDSYGFLPIRQESFASLPFTTNLVGYSGDNGAVSARAHWGCYVHEVNAGRLFNDCDSWSGVSGGPLVNLISGNYYIVGMAVSEFRSGAQDSVRIEAYAPAYANVAIPATMFHDTVAALLGSIDLGGTAPVLSNVVQRINPNPRPQPEPAPDPVGPLDPLQVVDKSLLRERTSALFLNLDSMRLNAGVIVDYTAAPYGSSALSARANAVVTIAERFKTLVLDFAQGEWIPEPRRAMDGHFRSLSQEVAKLLEFLQDPRNRTLLASSQPSLDAIRRQLRAVDDLLYQP